MIDNEIRENLDKISAQIRRQYSESLRELGLYVGQDNLLCKLWSHGEIKQIELTEMLGCEASTLTNMIKTLEKNGFVSRKKDPQDGRASLVFLTEKGWNVQKPIEEMWHDQQNKLLKGFSEGNRSLLNNFLLQMEKNLR